MDQSHYYRQVWYWGGEADLRVNGNKMELTSIPQAEWNTVVADAEVFWDELASRSPRAAKVIDIFKKSFQNHGPSWRALPLLRPENMNIKKARL